MKSTFNIILFFLFAITPRQIYAQPKQLTMEGFVHNLSLYSPLAEIVKSTYQNELLQFYNYQKSYLPSVGSTANSFSFNNSLK